MRALLATTALTAALIAAPSVGAAPGGGSDAEPRLLAKRAGNLVCLTYVGGTNRAPVRACLRPAAADTIRVNLRLRSCGGRPPGLFGIAPAGTRKVNFRLSAGARPVRLRVWRIPRRIHPAGGTAFVVRRSVDGANAVLTAYGADGGRLAQLRPRFPIPACPGEEPRTPVPGR